MKLCLSRRNQQCTAEQYWAPLMVISLLLLLVLLPLLLLFLLLLFLLFLLQPQLLPLVRFCFALLSRNLRLYYWTVQLLDGCTHGLVTSLNLRANQLLLQQGVVPNTLSCFCGCSAHLCFPSAISTATLHLLLLRLNQTATAMGPVGELICIPQHRHPVWRSLHATCPTRNFTTRKCLRP